MPTATLAPLWGAGSLSAVVPEATSMLLREGTHLHTALTAAARPSRSTNPASERACTVDSLLRHLVVALHSCPNTARNIAAGAQSPVHGQDREQFTFLVRKHLRAAAAPAADSDSAVQTIAYEAIGTLAAAWREHGNTT